MLNVYLEAFGVFVGAIAGAIASSRVRMDLFGVIVCGTVAAIGGGTTRDLLIGQPVFWTIPGLEIYLTVAVCSALFAFLWVRLSLPIPIGTIRILDAIVLAMFAYVGTAKALRFGFSIPVSITMGVITGVAGGMGRDLLTGNVPYVLRPGELYATAALIGCFVYTSMVCWWGFSPDQAAIPCILTTIVVRVAAIRWNWNLPGHRDLFTHYPSGSNYNDGRDSDDEDNN